MENKQVTAGVLFQCLLIIYETKTFSMRQAIEIVGGNGRLKELIDNGSIRATKGERNCSWRINAADCIRNIRPALIKKILKYQN